MKSVTFHTKRKIRSMMNNYKIRERRALILTAAILCVYPPVAFSEIKDLARFEVAKRYFRQGSIHFNNMNYLAAVEFFRKAVKEYPDYYTARDNLARSYRLAGYTDAALREWESLQEIMPDNAAIASKIETIRFQEIPRERPMPAHEYVFHEIYRSSRYQRFHFNSPVDLAVDDEKNIYLTSFSDGTLVTIDGNGKAVSSMKTALTGKLYGVASRGKRLVVSDFTHDKVHLLNQRGDMLATFGTTGAGEGEFHGPEGVAFDSSGNIYVVDSGNCRVQKFDDGGRFILQFGRRGEYEGELTSPTDLAVVRGRVYVADAGNRRLACFDDSGNFIENISIEGMEAPRGVSSHGDILVIADEKRGIAFYDTAAKSATWFEAPAGSEPIKRAVAAVIDRDGYLYCLDHDRSAVYLFAPSRKRYSNLDIEITSVDTASFPVVAFYVNVRGREGSPLYSLDASNFLITEDGAPITNCTINYLKKLLPSVSIALCVDRSVQAEEYRGDIPWVAEFILKQMRKNDACEVIHFNRKVWQASRFDWSRRRTLKALKERDYAKGKNFGMALYMAVSDCAPRLNRRGVFLITDGSVEDDSFSTYSVDTIVAYARAHYIPIFILSFREPSPQLVTIATRTGGSLYRPRQADGLRSIYPRIKNAEEYRYVLVYPTYKLPSFKGWWSDVKIEVQYKGQRGVEWGGYFVP